MGEIFSWVIVGVVVIIVILLSKRHKSLELFKNEVDLDSIINPQTDNEHKFSDEIKKELDTMVKEEEAKRSLRSLGH